MTKHRHSIAKREREQRVKERRAEKHAKKASAREAARAPDDTSPSKPQPTPSTD